MKRRRKKKGRRRSSVAQASGTAREVGVWAGCDELLRKVRPGRALSEEETRVSAEERPRWRRRGRNKEAAGAAADLGKTLLGAVIDAGRQALLARPTFRIDCVRARSRKSRGASAVRGLSSSVLALTVAAPR